MAMKLRFTSVIVLVYHNVLHVIVSRTGENIQTKRMNKTRNKISFLDRKKRRKNVYNNVKAKPDGVEYKNERNELKSREVLTKVS